MPSTLTECSTEGPTARISVECARAFRPAGHPYDATVTFNSPCHITCDPCARPLLRSILTALAKIPELHSSQMSKVLLQVGPSVKLRLFSGALGNSEKACPSLLRGCCDPVQKRPLSWCWGPQA